MNDPTLPERKGPPSPSDAVGLIGENANPYRMVDEFDIGEALIRLATHGDAVSIYPADGSPARLARIFSVEEETPDFVVELNEDLDLPPGPATFVAWLQTAKIQFTLERDWQAAPEQPKMLPCVFPKECLVLERRKAARLDTPLGQYFTASFMIASQPYELQLYDISAGGVGMRAVPRETVGLYVGRPLRRVRLELGPSKVITTDMEIRLTRTYRSFLLGEQTQIGCSFINLTPALQSEIEEFVDELASGRKLR